MYTVLHDSTTEQKTGNSDKLYVVGIEKTPGGYSVFALYGRRGKVLRKQIKGSYVHLWDAVSERNMHIRKKSKRSSKRCYIDVSQGEYKGRVTKDSPCVFDYLPPNTLKNDSETISEVAVTPAPAPKKIEVDEANLKIALCLDNSGLAGFEEGLEYVVVKETSKTLFVLDMEDNKVEVFKNKFGTVCEA